MNASVSKAARALKNFILAPHKHPELTNSTVYGARHALGSSVDIVPRLTLLGY
jgi:hypothetical protein